MKNSSLFAATIFSVISCSTSKTNTTDIVYAEKIKSSGAMFHKNFSSGYFEKNGDLVTDDIYVNSNNTILIGRDKFVERIKRYNGPFPGMQLKDRIVLAQGNTVAVHYILQGYQKGKYGNFEATGNKVEAMSAEFFQMDENGLMKNLLTITQLDKLVDQIKGEKNIEQFQEVTLLPVLVTVDKAKTTKSTDSYLRNFNARNWEALSTLLDENINVNWNGTTIQGRENCLVKFKERLIPFPDLTFQLDRSVIEGNRAAIGYTMIGKQTGNYNYKWTEIAASNKSIQVREAQFLEFNSYGKINSIIVVSNENDIISIIK